MQQKEIKSIEFVFENCECLTIDGKYIGDLVIDNIKTSIYRVACNSIERMNTCESFAISIHRSSNVLIHTGFDMGYPLDRINKYNDITYIIVTYNDDTKEEICVEWSDHPQNNSHQKSLITEKGDLYLVIDKELDINDRWDNSEFNDTYKWTVYGIE